MFTDRRDAGQMLAKRLKVYKKQPGVLLAVPRGGVPLAFYIAKELEMPIDLVLIKKLGHPMNKEYAIGAVGLTDRLVVPHDDVPDSYIESETEKMRARLYEMRQKFMGDRKPEDLRGKIVIVVDDGIATGNTMLATVQLLRKAQPAKIVVAVPVASDTAMEKLAPIVDEIVVLYVPEVFYGVGRFYQDFRQVSDEQVMDYLEQAQEDVH